MFLLNSRALLGTIGYDFHHSQVLFRSYNSNWPNSLNHGYTKAIGYTPRRPDAVIGTGPRFLRITVVWSGWLHGPHRHPMASASEALPAIIRASSVDLFPRYQKPSYREEIPASRCARGGQPLLSSPLRAWSYAMSGVFPFSPKRLGPTNSGPVHVAQKPFSSSASRVLTWINATSIGICNTCVSTCPHGHASQTHAHPPTPSTAVEVLGYRKCCMRHSFSRPDYSAGEL